MRLWEVAGKSSPPSSSSLCMYVFDDSHTNVLLCSVLCSELAVKLVNEPFISANDDKNEWAL